MCILDDWQTAHGLFAYELATGVLIGLVINNTLSKSAAISLIEEAKSYLASGYPSLEKVFDEISAKATAQVSMLSIEGDRLVSRADDSDY